MQTIARILQIEVLLFLVGLAAIVFYRMVIGAINTRGLLQAKGFESGFSPARLQLLISTVGVAFYYLGQALTSANTGQFPAIPNEMLLILGGSHTLYLGSKTIPKLIESFGSSKDKGEKS